MELTVPSYSLVVTLSGLSDTPITEKKSIEVKAKSASLFIQTDKAMYRPGERGQHGPLTLAGHHVEMHYWQQGTILGWYLLFAVKYRVFGVGATLLPYTDAMNITITVSNIKN